MMEMAENKLKEHYICGSSTSGFSMNTPEETDDETASLSVDVPSAEGTKEESTQAAILSSGSPCAPFMGAVAPDTYGIYMSRVPCESDESSSFMWNPPEKSAEELPSHNCTNLEKVAACDYRIKQEKPAHGLQERSVACARGDGILETAAAAQGTCPQGNTDLDSLCAPQGKSALILQY